MHHPFSLCPSCWYVCTYSSIFCWLTNIVSLWSGERVQQKLSCKGWNFHSYIIIGLSSYMNTKIKKSMICIMLLTVEQDGHLVPSSIWGTRNSTDRSCCFKCLIPILYLIWFKLESHITTLYLYSSKLSITMAIIYRSWNL